MSIHDYLIDHCDLDWPALLQEWTWLIPKEFTVWMMNRFGDLFIILDDRSVHRFDVGTGTLDRLAKGRGDFADKIDQDDNANNWLMIPLVDRLVARGIMLPKGKCYSYKRPPVLGADYTVENACVVTIAEHYGMYGSLHRQIKDVPDGTKVEIKLYRGKKNAPRKRGG